MKPKISIIMPSLNVVNYIQESLQSVITQTLSDIEIICVDAGSTDGTFEILEQFACTDSRIRVLRSDKKSYGYQMNLGIKAAHGEYIGIVETDDFVIPEMYECLYEIAEEYKVDFVKSGYTSFFDFGGQRHYFKNQCMATRAVNRTRLDLVENDKYRLIDLNHIWSGIYCRDFLSNNDLWFNETQGASFQDTSFSILVGLVAETCIYTDDCFYHYRTDRMESSVKSDLKYGCVVDEFAYIEYYLKKHNINTEQNEELVAKRKIEVYRWNLMRLSNNSRKLFCEEIVDEMLDFEPGGRFHNCLSVEQKNAVELLTDPSAVEIYEIYQMENTEKALAAIEDGKRGEKYIFVGAGNYLHRFLDIQEMLRCTMISAVCDNNKAIQGKTVERHIILSVEEAAGLYPDMKWLVVNKYHSEAIRRQLLELGIPDNQIICITYLPSESELYERLSSSHKNC